MGLIVKVLVMDMGNHHIQSELNIANGATKFPNPSRPGEFIHIMPDPIHGLKNLRNHIVDHGAVFKWRGETIKLGKEDFEAVINEFSKPGEPSILYKVDVKTHLILTNQEKQNVPKAFQLLSQRMANAFKLSGREHQGEIISIIDNFFALTNSRAIFTINPYKCAFGKILDLQMKAIFEFKELMLCMKINPSGKRKRHAMLPFQKGLLCDIESLLNLKEELQIDSEMYLFLSKVHLSS